MDPKIEPAYQDVDRDLAPEWIELSSNVRQFSIDLVTKARNSELSREADSLSEAASLLCDHVERLHTDVAALLAELDDRIPVPENAVAPEKQEPQEDGPDIHEENIRIQNEKHEISHNVRDVIKALFMWKDDPVERARGKKTVV